MKKFKYVKVLFTCEGKMEREIDRLLTTASAVMRMLYQTAVVKRELRSQFTGQSRFQPSPMVVMSFGC